MRRASRWTTAPAMALLLAACAARAEETVRAVDWTVDAADAGEVMEEGGRTFLRLEGADRPLVLQVLSLEEPSLHGPRYALRGDVRYRDVEGAAYLEMWTELPGGGRYFTRTLAEVGPMAGMRGSSDWRPVELPFDLTGSDETPERLVVNVVLPGAGTVDLSNLELVDGLP